MSDIETQFNISAVSTPSLQTDAELGHQVVSPIWGAISKYITSGFFTSLALNFCSRELSVIDRAAVGAFAASATVVDLSVSDYAKQLSFDHEHAREEWEHEFNPIGEVDEYIAYAEKQGLAPSKARDIAMLVTAEPSISVPYHLAFELAMLEPKFYKHKLKHAGIALGSYAVGFSLSEATHWVARRHLVSMTNPIRTVVLSGLLALTLAPVLIARYQSVSHVRGAPRFKALTVLGYSSCIVCAVVALQSKLK
jgi:hypothetical protein